MASYLATIPPLSHFFPPTPRASELIFNILRTFPLVTVLLWLPTGKLQAQGKTSVVSRFNLPGRWAWAAAELVGPINLIFILYSLPPKLRAQPESLTSFLGTGMPAQSEIMGLLYVLHYLNRAIATPLYFAPSMSPIHVAISSFMATFQFLNSSNIATWIVYSPVSRDYTWEQPLVSFMSVIGLLVFAVGLTGNIRAEHKLFDLRRGAAKRKARSEGKPTVTYDKVYVIPPVEGVFKTILYPHYVFEWLEWIGYWILGGAWGFSMGYESAALCFVISEVTSMLPRAVSGKRWYGEKFGKRAVAGRAGAIPFLGL